MARLILVCGPTGAGKTNVAMLTMLNILGQYRKQQTNDDGEEQDSYDLNNFKIVYISPMKALVQEQVKNFSERLLLIRCKLVGDVNFKCDIKITESSSTTPWHTFSRNS